MFKKLEDQLGKMEKYSMFLSLEDLSAFARKIERNKRKLSKDEFADLNERLMDLF